MENFPIACLIQTSGLLLEILLLDQIIAISAKHAARMRIEPYDLMFFRIISCNRNQREQHYTLPHTVCVLARIIMTKSAKLEKLANHVKVYKSLNDKSEKTFKSSNCSRFRYICWTQNFRSVRVSASLRCRRRRQRRRRINSKTAR